MSKILIISATADKNLELANELQSLLSSMGMESDLIVMDKLELPLYSYEAEVDPGIVEELIDKMNLASGFIFCSPEYNGGVPPVLSNAITWISVKSKNWRDVFNGKYAIIGTHSGGDGYRFLTAFRSQLEYLGTNVLARTISVTKEKPLKEDSAKRILQGLVDLV
ncbi:MAG: NAD(P)H-dependent oxidoreductase [Candidatus Marinimicrobia bacterium]|nr:NAD(P)H-dependent oxidoreductase [Candidatus Neomarinimicrobiota bacterium]MBL7031536.1 NAD(P)H-dependent oxidoreductase [Candidatus Neomarinimicrobiota bacterium]